MQSQYRQIPLQTQAEQNEFNEPRELTDSSGTVFMVPAGFWLVEYAPGAVSMMSDVAFRSGFEKYQEPTPLDSFVNTVADLRNEDRASIVRANQLETRIAALEAAEGTRAATNDMQGIVESILNLRSAVAACGPRLNALENQANANWAVAQRVASLESLVQSLRAALAG